MAAQYSHSRKHNNFKGVRLRKWGRWAAEIRVPNSRKKIWLGSFSSIEQAAMAYDAASYCLRGPNSHFNFPDSPPKNIDPNVIDSADAVRAVSRDYAMQLNSVDQSLETTPTEPGVILHDIIPYAEESTVAADNNIIHENDFNQRPNERVLNAFFDDIFMKRDLIHYFAFHRQELENLHWELGDIATFHALWDFAGF